MSLQSKAKLDDLDISILEHLMIDGRKSFTEIARELGVSHSTIHNRYAKMRANHGLRIASWIYPQDIGLEMVVKLLISVETPNLEKVVAKIIEFPEVHWVARISGEYDLEVDLACFDHHHFKKLLSDRFQKMSGIRHIKVLPFLDYYKSEIVPNVRLLRQISQTNE